MKKAALIIGLVTAQAFAIGAFAQAAPPDPLALPNKPHLDVKPGPGSQTAEGTTAAAPGPKAVKPKPPTKAEKAAAKKERIAARETRAADRKVSASGSATSPLYPNAVGSPSTGPK